MKIQFDYTFEDLREAQAAHQEHVRATTQKSGRAGGTAVAGAFVVMSLVPLLGARQPYGLLDILIPISTVFMLVLAITLAGSVGWRSRLKLIGGLLGLLVLFGLLYVVLFRLGSPSRAPGALAGVSAPRPAWSWGELLAPHLIWILLFVSFASFTIWYNRRLIRQNWEKQPALQRPHTLEVVEGGVIIDNVLERQECRWPAFVRYAETPHLFLLYPSEISFHMVPKRALADEAQVKEFRALLHEMIENRLRAFPVLVETVQ